MAIAGLNEPGGIPNGIAPSNKFSSAGSRLGSAILRTLVLCSAIWPRTACSSDSKASLESAQWSATTADYARAAFEMLLAEVNAVAHDLKLAERFPIKAADVTDRRI